MSILGTTATTVGRVRWLLENDKLRIGDRRLKPSEASVLIEMAANADSDGLTWCPQDNVAARTRLSVVHVGRVIKALDEYLVFVKSIHGGKKLYKLTLPKDGLLVTAPTVPTSAASSSEPHVWVPRRMGEIIPREELERRRFEQEARQQGRSV